MTDAPSILIHVGVSEARGGIAALNRLALGFTLTMSQKSDVERLRSNLERALQARQAEIAPRAHRITRVSHWLDCLPVSYLQDALASLDHAALDEDDLAALNRAQRRLETNPA